MCTQILTLTTTCSVILPSPTTKPSHPSLQLTPTILGVMTPTRIHNRNVHFQAMLHIRIRARRSCSVDSSAPADRPTVCRRLFDADDSDVTSVPVRQTARHISQSYGQRVLPIGPFIYTLIDTNAQFFIAHATARGTDLLTDFISSPISPSNSPSVPNHKNSTTNHTPELCQPSVTSIGTDT